MRIAKKWKIRLGSALVALELFCLAGPAAARIISNPDPNDPSGGVPPTPPAYVYPVNGFDWRAKDRYQMWPTAWRSREEFAAWQSETYNPAYVNPTKWKLTMMGCQSANDFFHAYDPKKYAQAAKEDETLQGPEYKYRWTWNGVSTGWESPCYADLDFPAEGTYHVTLQVRDLDGAINTYTNPVEVKDFLIVVLGDSSASGEGAPDVKLEESNSGRAEWVDNRCHRSMNAGSAQAARRLEIADPKTSVTFLSFACSGATLKKKIYDNMVLDPYNPQSESDLRGVGMTAPYAGIEPIKNTQGDSDFSQKLPSQVDQLWNALTNFSAHEPRKVDTLIVAGGINDARFADLAGLCVLAPFCYEVQTGVLGPNPRTLHDQFMNHDVKDVPAGWDALNQQLLSARSINTGPLVTAAMQFDQKLALQYPPFFHDDEGDRCVYILHQAVPIFIKLASYVLNPLFPVGWAFDEIAYGIEDWAPELEKMVKLGAERNDFEYVDTIASKFHNHGVCADDRFINNPLDSAEDQGDAHGEDGYMSTLSAKGSAHPNTKGYAAYATEILRHLGHLQKKEGNVPPFAMSDQVWTARGKATTFNVLANDTDEDTVDVLAVRLLTEPQNGTVKMKKDGTTTYNPRPGFLGEDEFQYELTDGTDVRYAIVRITVAEKYVVETISSSGIVTELSPTVVTGGLPLLPPYVIVFDKPLKPRLGNVYFEEDDGVLYFDPPPVRRRNIRMRYTLHSATMNPLTGVAGGTMRGELRFKVRRP